MDVKDGKSSGKSEQTLNKQPVEFIQVNAALTSYWSIMLKMARDYMTNTTTEWTKKQKFLTFAHSDSFSLF